MFTRIVAPLALVLAFGLAAAEARNPAYYGTSRGVSARFYSGEFQANRPKVVPTFTLPATSGGFRYYRGGRYGRLYRPVYQPVIVYPPVVYYGF